jgi:hypothetical protein
MLQGSTGMRMAITTILRSSTKRVHTRLGHRLHVVQPTVGTSVKWVSQCGVVRFSSIERPTARREA